MDSSILECGQAALLFMAVRGGGNAVMNETRY
jgi:hypothetical protein